MTRPDIEAAIARAEKATEQPWEQAGKSEWDHCEVLFGRKEERLSRGHAGLYGDNPLDNSIFIAAARTDVPELARYALALEARTKRLSVLVKELIGYLETSQEWPNELMEHERETIEAARTELVALSKQTGSEIA